MNFSLNNRGSFGNLTCENVSGSKFTLTRHFPLKPEKVGQPPLSRIDLPYAIAMHSKSSGELLTSKGTAADVFKQGLFPTCCNLRQSHLFSNFLNSSTSYAAYLCVV